MQHFTLHNAFRTIIKIDTTEYSEIALNRKKKIEIFDSLIQEGCSEGTALRAIECSRATIYRHKSRYQRRGLQGLEIKNKKPFSIKEPQWTKDLEDLVCFIRTRFPFFGKQKITIILSREHGLITSESTVGRILSKLLKQQRIKPVSYYSGKYCPKKRIFNDHAQRLPTGLKSQSVGDLVQVDHMTVRLYTGRTIKQFSAICPVSRVLVCKAYEQATSLNAADFLNFVRQQMPFPILSIQVDGGSEFRSEFEQQCKDFKIPLKVLPPRSPQINGTVERSNGILKEEFYSLYNSGNNLRSINEKLTKWLVFYNSYRPHSGLRGLTPLAYYK